MDRFTKHKTMDEGDLTGIESNESSKDEVPCSSGLPSKDGHKDEQPKSMCTSSAAAPSCARKKAKYEPKFSEGWLSNPLFSPWLQKKQDSSGKFVPFCSICKVNITLGKSAIVRHKDSKAHEQASKMNEELARSQPGIHTFFQSSSSIAPKMEIKMCSFLVENNLPISLLEDLLALMKSLFPSDENLKHVTLGKQKATNTIRQVLGFHYMKEGIEQLRGHKFSLIIDETTDKSTKSQMAVIGVYFEPETFTLNTVLIDLTDLPDGKANTIYETVCHCLQEKGIPMENVIGFCANKCNVMFGSKHSVSQLLRKNHPWIVTVKCSCHLIHLCASHVSLQLPKSLEDLCRNIYSHFRLSSQRCEALKEFQDLFNVEKHRILRAGRTRWLSMKMCVDRILEQFEALKLYFQGVSLEDPTHTNDAILKSLNNKVTVAYLEFMSFNLGSLTTFNKIFQSEVPLLHTLKKEVSQLLMALCADFMELSYLRNSDPLTVNVKEEAHHVPLCKVYTGVNAEGTIQSISEDIGSNHPDIMLFKVHCKQFLMECACQIQQRFNNLQELDFLQCLDPKVAFHLTIPSFASLYKKLPYLEEVAALQEVDSEWRIHSMQPSVDETMSVLEYWKTVLSQRDA